MKRIISLLICFLLAVPMLVFPASAAGASNIYVSTEGSDKASGTLDAPLKTVSAAKEKAKNLSGNVTVYFRKGTYSFDDTVNFTSEDKANVTYKAYNGEKVVFTAGTPYTGFEECTVNGVKAFRKNVGKDADIRTLFNEETTFKITRYPENGYLYPAKIENDYCQNTPEEIEEDDGFLSYTAMTVNPGEMPDFRNPDSVVVRILHWWKDELLPVKSYNAETGFMEFTKSTSKSIRLIDKFFLENAFEALNETHEWYFDKADGMLYYIPEEGETPDTLTLWGGSLETLIRVSEVDGISFENIVFRGNGYTITEGRDQSSQAASDAKSCLSYDHAHNFTVKNCEFRDLASCAVRIGSAVTDAAVDSCVFENIGAQAVYIRGENVEVDSPEVTKNITVNNNIVSGYGRVFFNAVGILVIHANSVSVTHNEIHDGYYTAISVGWSWGYDYSVTYNNKICDNLIYNIGQGWLSDMGGIYTLGIQTGTVISGNVIHNVAADPDEGGYGGWGIYLDEGSSGILVEKNLAFACGSDCYHLHYGKDNMVRNNIFALSADSQIHAVSRGEGHKTADFIGNIVLTDKNTPAFSYLTTAEEFHADGNIVWDLSKGDKMYTDGKTLFSMSMPISTAEKKGLLNNCIFTDPMFTDPQNFDFTFSDGGETVAEYGFEAWDYSNAGTLRDSIIGLDRAGGQTGYNDEAKAQTLNPADTRINPTFWLFVVAVLLGAAVLILAIIAAKKASMPAKLVFLAVPVASAAICPWLYSVFVHWNPAMYAILLTVFILLSGLVLLYAKKRDSKKAAFLTYLIPTVIFAVLFMGVVMLLNNALRIGEPPSILSGYIVAGAFYIVSFVFVLKGQVQRNHKEP